MLNLLLGEGDLIFSWNSTRRLFYFNRLLVKKKVGESVTVEELKKRVPFLTIHVTDIRSIDILLESLTKFRSQMTHAHLPAVPKLDKEPMTFEEWEDAWLKGVIPSANPDSPNAKLYDLWNYFMQRSVEFKTGDIVMVHDRFRFAVPIKGRIEEFSKTNDGVKVHLLEGNENVMKSNPCWVSINQLRKC